ncbi:hypothetical protein ACX3YG_19645 [Pseudomonas wadenswilerensis]
MTADFKNKLFIDRKLRTRWITSLTPIGISIFLKLYVDFPYHPHPSMKVTIAEYAYPAFFAAGLFYVLFWYLQTGFRDRKIFEQDPNTLNSHDEQKQLKSTIKAQESRIDYLVNKLAEASEHRTTYGASSYIYPPLEQANEAAPSASRIDHIISLTQDSSFGRIRAEIHRCGFRSIIYLASGVFLAILGILALAGFVFPNAFGIYSQFFNTAPEVGSSDYATAIHYLPKFSFIISIEILAYFFLRLHKSNLVEAKYYQNELTNLEARYLSLVAALHIERAETSHKVISSLVETERNHILEKGQTTIELKKIEMEKNQFVEITKSLISLAPKSK